LAELEISLKEREKRIVFDLQENIRLLKEAFENG
jgi:hypothetical protein